jgi:predicted N-acyltransferase
MVISSSLSRKGYRCCRESSNPTYVVDCTKSFDDYLASLGKNTRLRLYNRRKLFEQMGTVSLEPLTKANRREFFEVINIWHGQRWGKPAFKDQAQQFLNSVFTLEPLGMSLAHSTLLKLNDRPISVMIDVLVNGRLYNIQQGYIEDFDKRISVGTLHLGYQIEAAFEDKAILQFDLLEGEGKNTNYKCRLARENVVLQSTRWCRSFLLKGLFALYDNSFRRRSRA